MPFTSKQKADYIEPIKELLDKISIKKLSDFDDVILDLQKILNAAIEDHISFHPDLQSDMQPVLDALRAREPVVYGVRPVDLAEYQGLVRHQISLKIKEFEEYTSDQKQQYIDDQQRKSNHTTANRAMMRAAESAAAAQFRRERDENLQQAEEVFNAEQRRIEEQIRHQRSNAATRRLNEHSLQMPFPIIHQVNHHIIGDLYLRLEERVPPTGSVTDYVLRVAINGLALLNHFMFLGRDQIELIRRNIGNINEIRNIFTNIITGEPANVILNDIIEAERRANQAVQSESPLPLRRQREPNTQEQPQQEVRRGRYHVVGDLNFWIQELPSYRRHGDMTHELTVVDDDGIVTHSIHVSSNHINLIIRNIGNINTLGNIFTNVIRDASVTNAVVEADRRANQAAPLWYANRTRITQQLNTLRQLNLLSTEREIQLSNNERARLAGNLFQHIARRHLSVDHALQLSDEQVIVLTTGHFSILIINGRLSIEQALQLSNEARDILTTGNIYSYINIRALSVERALQLTAEQRSILNNINAYSAPDLSIRSGQRSIEDVLRQLEQSPLRQRLDNFRENFAAATRQESINFESFMQMLNALSTSEQRGQFLEDFWSAQDRGQPTAQAIANSGYGIGYAHVRLFEARRAQADLNDYNEIIRNRINRLVALGHLTQNEANRLNTQEARNLTTPCISALIIANELTATEARALTEEQRSRLQNGEDVARVIRRREPSINSLD